MLREISSFIGTVSKTHGISGELVIRFENYNAEKYSKTGSIFIELDGQLVPFFVEKYVIKDDHLAIVKLEDINSENKARELAGCMVFTENRKTKKTVKQELKPDEIIGFVIIDKLKGRIGILKEIIENPTNPLFLILFDEKEFYIPITNEFIIEINYKGKVIKVNLPEGLIELND